MPASPEQPCLMAAWHAHERELRRWLIGHVEDPHTAQDLLQDIFMKALRQGQGFCDITNARAWLYEVARNTVTDHMRRRRAWVELPDDLPAAEDNPMPAVDSLASCLPRVLGELSAEDREAITECDLKGMSQEDYARKLGLSLPGAKSRIQRARKRLRAQLTLSCQVTLDPQGQVCCFVPRA
ncbi:RNA polymerase sigma70 [Aquabacterium sp. NJ1]|nr:RNA polymerase sigma70 [Aquabacterium sp. NJ1]